MHSYKNTYSTAVSLTLLPITGILSIIIALASASTEYIKIYLVIAISVYINIVYK